MKQSRSYKSPRLALRYIGGIYEKTVVRGPHVEGIRLHLASRGIARNPAMVRHELDNVFRFCEYADSHPAPVALSLAQIVQSFGY